MIIRYNFEKVFSIKPVCLSNSVECEFHFEADDCKMVGNLIH